MTKSRRNIHFTTNKIGDSSTNEDAVISTPNIIAVSDGAGGCGIFAERWSKYLLDNIPSCGFDSFDIFNQWTESIWQLFYDSIDAQLKDYDNFVGNKFNKEGSFATLAAVWIEGDKAKYCCYGDSAIFVFDRVGKSMQFMSLEDVMQYDKNPYLINWKDLPTESAFRCGEVEIGENSMIFVASDALSALLTMAYYTQYDSSRLEACLQSDGKLKVVAESVKEYMEGRDFYEDLLLPISKCGNNREFRAAITNLHKEGVILDDDFSIAISHFAEPTKRVVSQRNKRYKKYKKNYKRCSRR